MSDREHDPAKLRRALGYIGVVREAMRMQNWDVILHPGVCEEEDVHAHTWQDDNHVTINIEFGDSFPTISPAQMKNTVVHELVHAQHRDVDRLWRECTQENDDVPVSQAGGWDSDMTVFMERFVSWITDRIVPSVPDYDPEHPYEEQVAVGCWMLGEHPN